MTDDDADALLPRTIAAASLRQDLRTSTPIGERTALGGKQSVGGLRPIPPVDPRRRAANDNQPLPVIDPADWQGIPVPTAQRNAHTMIIENHPSPYADPGLRLGGPF